MIRRKLKGFTLLEALVGLFIIGLVAMFTLTALNNGLQLSRETKEDTEKILYANRVVEIAKAGLYRKNLEIENIPKSEKFDFSVNVEDYDKLQKLQVKVWSKMGDGKDEREFSVVLPK